MDEAPTQCCPGCQKAVDVFGDHLLCCPRNNYSHRHGAVQEALVNCLVEAGQDVQKEAKIEDGDEEDRGLRPADLKLLHWEGGRHLAVDLTISHAWQASEQVRGNANPAVTREKFRRFLTRLEAAKHAKYDKACTNQGWAFKAMAFGTWGGVGPEGAKLLHRIVK